MHATLAEYRPKHKYGRLRTRSVEAFQSDSRSRKEYAVLKAVEVFGTVKSREALSSILYFADLKRHTFNYRWCAYGVCSPELEPMISYHVYFSFDAKGKREEKAEHDLRLSARGVRLLGNNRHEEIDAALDWARGLLDGVSPRQMDLLASVHFLSSCGNGRIKVREIMLEMKPVVVFTAGEVEWATEFLEGKGVLEPETATGTTRDPVRIPA